MSIAQNFPAIAPSLLLDFANVQALDNRITFARATTGTYYGTRTALAEQNLLLQSQTFDNASWAKVNAIVTADTTTAPDGTMTADTLQTTATTAAFLLSQNLTLGVNTTSIYAQNGTANFFQLTYNGDTTSYANFDLSTGVVGTSVGTVTHSITNVGGGWYRLVVVNSSTAVTGIVWGIVQSASATRRQTFTAAGTETVFIWGAQLEQRSAVTAYNVTTTQPITNYIPVLETAAIGVARFDHNPTTFESLGLLVEQQSTNLVTYSEQFDNAAWTKSNATVAANTIIAPDGTLTGDAVVEATGTVSPLLSGGSGFLANTGNSISLYVKAVTGGATRYVYIGAKIAANTRWAYFLFNPATGTVAGGPFNDGIQNVASSPTVTSVGNEWYRISIIFTSPLGAQIFTVGLTNTTTPTNAAILGSYTGDGYSGVYIWGAQNEAVAVPTSYIPTVASQVTRAADSASMTGTNFSSWYNAGEGTLYTEASVLSVSQGGYRVVASIADNTSSETNFIAVGSQGSTGRNLVLAGSAQADFTTGAIVANTPFKTVLAYKVNDFASSINGSAASTDTTGILPPVTQIFFGQSTSAGISRHNGTIKKFSYYPLRLTNTNLQALTG